MGLYIFLINNKGTETIMVLLAVAYKGNTIFFTKHAVTVSALVGSSLYAGSNITVTLL